jgi:hypothetical protein
VEIRVNVVLMVLVGLTWLGLRAHAPAPVESGQQWVSQLAALEDAFGADPSDKRAVVALIDAYLEEGYPLLAVAALRSAEPVLLEEPVVSHQLARAYEASGRLLDALATADLALARCSRAIGARHLDTAVPHYACSERTFAMLDTHKSALERMVRWGIVDPRVDPRAQRAYDLALRRARIAIGELPAGPAVP